MTQIRKFNNDEFRPRTFVIDPKGCGCTDCGMGYSTPANELTVKQILAAYILGFELIDRRNADDKSVIHIPHII